jgi:hypothetical protein
MVALKEFVLKAKNMFPNITENSVKNIPRNIDYFCYFYGGLSFLNSPDSEHDLIKEINDLWLEVD